MIKIGVSSCLIGNKVRFDGGHKNDRYLSNWLSKFFDFIPVCPEMGIGMGVPRPTIRLVSRDGSVKVVGVQDNTADFTDPLTGYYGEVKHELEGIRGYVLKRGSPSCGMERVKVYSEKGMPRHDGVGVFAEQLMLDQPSLPVEEEGRLCDPVLRENFIARVFVYDRWCTLKAEGLSPSSFIQFHSIHKMQVLAHDTVGYRELGKLVAGVTKRNVNARAEEYELMLMQVLKKRATARKNTNVLQHLAGYLKKQLDESDKAELNEIFHLYRQNQLPLIVPITLLKHHFRRHPDEYANQQTYLNPHPSELMLRNFI